MSSTTLIKNNSYFPYEFRDTPNSFCIFVTDKSIMKLNLEQSDKFEIET